MYRIALTCFALSPALISSAAGSTQKKSYTPESPAVIRAAQTGDLNLLKKWILIGTPLDLKDEQGATAIHIAAANGQTHIVEYLLKEQGIDPDMRDIKEATALHIAACSNNVPLIKTLLIHDASIDAKNDAGITPTQAAALFGKNEALQFFLKESDANLQALTEHNLSLLHIAGCKGLHDAAAYMLERNLFAIDMPAENNYTAVHCAAAFNHPLIIDLLHAHGYNLHAQDTTGRTPLHLAIEREGIDSFHRLLELKVDIELADNEQFTALHHACFHNRLACVKALLDAGADVNAVTAHGLTALTIARQKGFTEIVELFKHIHPVHITVALH